MLREMVLCLMFKSAFFKMFQLRSIYMPQYDILYLYYIWYNDLEPLLCTFKHFLFNLNIYTKKWNISLKLFISSAKCQFWWPSSSKKRINTWLMQEPQSALEEKVNPSILKDDFYSRTEPSIFTSIEPLLLDRSKKPAEFSQHWNQQATSYPSPLYVVDQIQVQKPIQNVATDQTLDLT